jgi:shikimate dehydrogenase
VTDLPGRLVLIGDPVSHSLSPTMQNAALRAAHIPLTYEAVRVPHGDLGRLLEELREVSGAGNVTIPHKRVVLELCADLTGAAARAGACNTFRFENGQLLVDNTDVPAFDMVARRLLGDDIAKAAVTVLGAGGAAAAVLTAIERWPGAKVSIVNRRHEHATHLAQAFSDVARAEPDMDRALATATLVVNATPIGQHDDLYPCDLAALAPKAAVFDLVYRRGETPWVNEARRRGHRATDGMPMLLEQGALAFEKWFAVKPDREVMRRALQ